jgi:hypothetical protein
MILHLAVTHFTNRPGCPMHDPALIQLQPLKDEAVLFGSVHGDIIMAAPKSMNGVLITAKHVQSHNFPRGDVDQPSYQGREAQDSRGSMTPP